MTAGKAGGNLARRSSLDLREIGDAIERPREFPTTAAAGLARKSASSQLTSPCRRTQSTGARNCAKAPIAPVEILALERLAAGFATGGERPMQRLLLRLPQQPASTPLIVGLAVLSSPRCARMLLARR